MRDNDLSPVLLATKGRAGELENLLLTSKNSKYSYLFYFEHESHGLNSEIIKI